MSDLESRIEKECLLIMKTDAEYWEIRNKAILTLLSILNSFQSKSEAQDAFSMNTFRMLKDPIKSLLVDLRSQQVRDVCIFITKLSEVLGNHMKHLLREIFTTLLDGTKIPNRVMSGYIDNCIMSIIKTSTFKTCLPTLLHEIKDNKAKFVRERCLEYINEIILSWDINDKEADGLADAIKIGLEDASVRAREVSRLAYLNIFQLFPKKAEKIKSQLTSQMKKKMMNAEIEHLQIQNEKKEQLEKEDNIIDEATSIQVNENNVMLIGAAAEVVEKSDGEKKLLRARRMSYEENAVTSIQALIRGKLSRKLSISNGLLPQDRLSIGDTWKDSPTSPAKSAEPTISSTAKSFIPERKSSPMGNTKRNIFGYIGSPSSPMSSMSPTSPTHINENVLCDVNEIYPRHLTVGTRVKIKTRDPPTDAVIKFIGKTKFGTGYWIGVEVDDDSGKNDGTVNDQSYFKSKDKRGLFVRQGVLAVVGHVNRSSHQNFNDNNKKTKITGLLKLKMCNMMEYLHKQLEIIEELEKDKNKPVNNISTLIAELGTICENEKDLIKKFQEKLKSI